MTSTFRTVGAWGAGVGRPLTWAEQDNNTYDKETRLTALENPATGEGPVGIDHITVSGGQMTIYLTDSSIQGPFALPVASWSPQGPWQPSSVYQALDIVTFGGSAYLVNVDHTSATSFDPNETLNSVDLYTLLWTYASLPGFEDDGATFSPTLEHGSGYIRLTNAGGCAVTIDPNDVTFPAWIEITFRDCSTDTGAFCTFAVASPGSINGVSGFLNQSAGSGSTITLKKVGSTNAWDILGHLASEI